MHKVYTRVQSIASNVVTVRATYLSDRELP